MKTKKELTYFFLISFAWMWLLSLPRVLTSLGVIEMPPFLFGMLGYLAVFAPGIAAFTLTGINQGKAGMKSLWQRGWRLDFPRKWLIPTLVIMPVMGLLTYVILAVLDLPIFWEYALPLPLLVPIGLLIWLVGAYPEEYGWRGYAQDRLLEFFSPLKTSLILGLVWGLWHLPLHFIEGTTQAVIPVWEYVSQTILLTVIYTWLHKNTAGSIFVAAAFHAMGNIMGALLPYWVTTEGRWISFGLLLIVAVMVGKSLNRADT